eukprot:TRINITY_DN39386_c0_g1_i1.p1 TRINITY_DN39386_c0_g1~~TRINITY_DN39386_c0_g1_i1.p1  ORF type:complete len:148 (+),score=29.03 TRINITY_DN39386_c0_g1_i1:46-444(+)
MGYTYQDLMMMHADDLKQLFDEMRLTARDRIVIRQAVAFPGEVFDCCIDLLKFVAFAAVFSARLARFLTRTLTRPIPLITTLCLTSAVYHLVKHRDAQSIWSLAKQRADNLMSSPNRAEVASTSTPESSSED